jgi:hypothetical protein
MFMREHNNIVEELRTIGWNGEELFQEARKILTGIYQHIIYSEFLPVKSVLKDSTNEPNKE